MNFELVPFLVDKPVGATPLEALGALRRQLGLAADMKLAYAGRLDPMASGLLVVLHGELLKNQEQFWHLKKVYEASIALGLGSDSYDVLGLAELNNSIVPDDPHIITAVRSLVGKTLLSVPTFSSYRYKGRPLFKWARENEPAEVPVRRMAVSEIEVRDVEQLTLTDIAQAAIERCSSVHGDFRQEDICTRWRGLAQKDGQHSVPVVRLTLACESGTYVRSLAHELGRRLKTAGLLLELRRTVVGPFKLDAPAVVRFAWPQ